MKRSGVRKSLSLTTRSSGILRRGVFLGYCGFKFERHLKVVLLSGTMGVLGSLAAYAGSSSVPLGTNIGNMAPAGSVAAQTVDECLEQDIMPWDIACLLLRPVGTIPADPPSGSDDDDDDDDDHDNPGNDKEVGHAGEEPNGKGGWGGGTRGRSEEAPHGQN